MTKKEKRKKEERENPNEQAKRKETGLTFAANSWSNGRLPDSLGKSAKIRALSSAKTKDKGTAKMCVSVFVC